jgi:hypothetical protein
LRHLVARELSNGSADISEIKAKILPAGLRLQPHDKPNSEIAIDAELATLIEDACPNLPADGTQLWEMITAVPAVVAQISFTFTHAFKGAMAACRYVLLGHWSRHG